MKRYNFSFSVGPKLGPDKLELRVRDVLKGSTRTHITCLVEIVFPTLSSARERVRGHPDEAEIRFKHKLLTPEGGSWNRGTDTYSSKHPFF